MIPLSVRPSVCPVATVPDPKSRTEWRGKLKIGKTQVTRDPIIGQKSQGQGHKAD